MKKRYREAALKRMSDMLEAAMLSSDIVLAEKYASMAWRTSTKHRIRMPYIMRFMFCKKCKRFIRPGVDSRIRLGGRRPQAVRITCLYCGHT
ncbi:MAG: RNase P subunit, partial [Cenarchaeum sp. SB0672_bin_9]|nr:RNase P subunit [Cenarchaeum sp. SB0672_bin_9]